MNRKIPISEYTNIVKLYQNGLSSTKISIKYNIAEKCIVRILKKNGLSMRPKSYYRKYNITESFFENTNQWGEEQSYLFGFIMGDGHNNIRLGTLSIILAEKDKEHLLKLNSLIQNSELQYIDNEKYRKKYKMNRQNQYRMMVYSRKVSNDLLNLGIVNNKTIECHIPIFLTDENMRHFFRGLFDADGCFCLSNNRLNFKLTGNKYICEETLIYLKNKLGMTSNSLIKSKKSDICYTFSLTRKEDLQKLYHYLYDNSKLFLDRKKKICDEYFAKNVIVNKQSQYRRVQRTVYGKYVATCSYKTNAKKYVGTFDKEIDAAIASDKALINAIGVERAKYKTNFPIGNYI
jgi:hypothetical protein